jgi:hypothetical protein
MIGTRGHSGADRHRTRHSGKLPAIHHPPQFLGYTECMLLARLREQDGEFLPPVTANYVNLSELLREN